MKNSDNLLLLSSMRPSPLACSGLAFLSLFALFSLWICISVCFVYLYVFLYAYVCFCVFFHLNGIFYAVFVPFIVLFIVHIFWYCNIWHFMLWWTYNFIAVALLVVPVWPQFHEFFVIFIWKFLFPPMSLPNPWHGAFFVCSTVWENSWHLTRRQVRRPSVPLTPLFNAAWLPYS